MCQLFCGDAGALWPKPTKHYSIDNRTVHLDPEKIRSIGIQSGTKVDILLQKNLEKFKKHVQNLSFRKSQSNGNALTIHFIVTSDHVSMTLDTDESYVLSISQNVDGKVNLYKYLN